VVFAGISKFLCGFCGGVAHTGSVRASNVRAFIKLRTRFLSTNRHDHSLPVPLPTSTDRPTLAGLPGATGPTGPTGAFPGDSGESCDLSTSDPRLFDLWPHSLHFEAGGP